jgi:hypothetical protein
VLGEAGMLLEEAKKAQLRLRTTVREDTRIHERKFHAVSIEAKVEAVEAVEHGRRRA